MTTTTISAEASSKKIYAVIDKLSKAGHDLNDQVQDVIIMLMEHATGVGAGDVTGFARLINRLPDNFDKIGIVKFSQKCTPLRFNKTKAGDSTTYTCSTIKENETRRDGTSLYVPWNIDYARAHKWYHANANNMKRQLDFYTANSAIDLVDKNIASLERMMKAQIEVGKEVVETDGKKETVVRYADRVPDDEKGMVRAIIANLSELKRNFKAQKLDAINDDNTIGEKNETKPEDVLRTANG